MTLGTQTGTTPGWNATWATDSKANLERMLKVLRAATDAPQGQKYVPDSEIKRICGTKYRIWQEAVGMLANEGIHFKRLRKTANREGGLFKLEGDLAIKHRESGAAQIRKIARRHAPVETAMSENHPDPEQRFAAQRHASLFDFVGDLFSPESREEMVKNTTSFDMHLHRVINQRPRR